MPSATPQQFERPSYLPLGNWEPIICSDGSVAWASLPDDGEPELEDFHPHNWFTYDKKTGKRIEHSMIELYLTCIDAIWEKRRELRARVRNRLITPYQSEKEWIHWKRHVLQPKDEEPPPNYVPETPVYEPPAFETLMPTTHLTVTENRELLAESTASVRFDKPGVYLILGDDSTDPDADVPCDIIDVDLSKTAQTITFERETLERAPRQCLVVFNPRVGWGTFVELRWRRSPLYFMTPALFVEEA
ncbi:hypothetical protein KEM52_005104, partial [Ascosphaera acerosa]